MDADARRGADGATFPEPQPTPHRRYDDRRRAGTRADPRLGGHAHQRACDARHRVRPGPTSGCHACWSRREPNDVAAQLQSLPGVAIVEPATIARVTVAANGHTYPTSLTGLEPATVMHGFRTPDGTAGTLPADGVLAGTALADKLGVRIGDDVTVIPAAGSARRGSPGRVGGRTAGHRAVCDERRCSIDHRTPDPTGTCFASTSDADRDRVRAAATGLTGVVAYTDTRAVEKQIDSYLVIFWVFAGAMLVLGALLAFTVIYVTMTVNLAERTGELATLRAPAHRSADSPPRWPSRISPRSCSPSRSVSPQASASDGCSCARSTTTCSTSTCPSAR